MKKLLFLLPLCAAVGGLLLTGCSKGGNAKSSSGVGSNSNPLDLKIKWVVGKKYIMQMELTQNSEMTPPGQSKPMKQRMDMTQDFSMSVLKELPNGGRQLELEFEGLTMSVTVGDRQMMSFESGLPDVQYAGDPTALMLNKIVGAKLQYLTDANGGVEKVEGWNEFNDRLFGGTTNQGLAMLKQMFNENTLKQYGSFTDMMPNHLAKIGDSWRVSRKMPGLAGGSTIDLDNTFKGWEQHNDHRCARIEYKGDISSSGGSAVQNMSVQIKKGKITGEIWYDQDLGMMVDSNGKQNLVMTVSAQGTPMTIQMSQNVRFGLVKTEDLAKK